jgi:hypothetical protein
MTSSVLRSIYAAFSAASIPKSFTIRKSFVILKFE